MAKIGNYTVGSGKNGVWLTPAIESRFPKVVNLQANCSSADLSLKELKALHDAIGHAIKTLEAE